MHARLPDGDLLRLPRLDRPHGDGLRGHQGDIAAARGAGVLRERAIRRGVANWEFTEVIEGLAEGELVVLSVDREGVKDGARAARDGRETIGSGTRARTTSSTRTGTCATASTTNTTPIANTR